MKISLMHRSGSLMDTITLPDDITTENFKTLFYSRFHYYPERQRWTVSSPRGPLLVEGSLQEDNNVHDGSILYFKDLGVQVSWRLVFALEYFGPLWISPLAFFLPAYVYGWTGITAFKDKDLTQILALSLIMIHYFKREFETLFIHRFSNATMPIVRVPINCGHYWILCGVMVSYFLFHPLYESPFDAETQKPVIYGLASLMIIFEFLNFKTHVILRNLRQRGTRERGIPRGWGFNQVSCANYLWETLAWLTFCVLVRTATAYFFTLVAFLQMAQWAMKKHSLYKRDFKDYPRCRKAIVPMVL